MIVLSLLLPSPAAFPVTSGWGATNSPPHYISALVNGSSYIWEQFKTTERPVETTRVQGNFATEACRMVRGLTQKQKAVCAESRSLIPVMLAGIETAIVECQKIMRNRRWNCSTFDLNVVFGKKRKPQLPGTKERAMIHAIASGGVVNKVALACYDGNITSCGGCDTSIQPALSTNAAYQWGACNKDVWTSAQFAKRMLDARENNYTPLSAVNLHNNEVGRETIYELAGKNCRCHGPSASCSIQTCWQSFPNFEKIAQRLRYKYDNAMFAVGTRRKTGVIKLKEMIQPSKRLANKRERDQSNVTKLYYLKDSPSYCDYDPRNFSYGTRGRKCTLTSGRWDNCEFLCCGRGYRTEEEVIESDCNCEFQFCCYVQCEKCKTTELTHYCL